MDESPPLQVRAYHKRFYTPSNCLVLVHGLVPLDSVQEALDEWYDKWLKLQGGASPDTPVQVVPRAYPRIHIPRMIFVGMIFPTRDLNSLSCIMNSLSLKRLE